MINFTKEQKAILLGTVLGDAYLQKTGEKNARLRLEHGAKQEGYLLWKVNKFKNLFQGKPQKISRIHPITKKKYHYIRFQSNSTPILGKWRKLFYRDGVKIIPEKIKSMFIEPLSLAVWYMDDGYFYLKDKNSYLYLGKVTLEEALLLRRVLSENFGIMSKVYNKKNKGFALFFGVKETIKLHEVIRPYILPEFDYKLLTDSTSLTP